MGPTQNHREASDSVGISELQLPHPGHRLLGAGVRRRDRQPEIALSVRAETDARSDVDSDLVQHMTRKANRVIPLRNRRPYIECRARSFDVPAEVVHCFRDQPMASRIYIASSARLLAPPMERL